MRGIFGVVLAIVLAGAGYLALWPVPIQPVAWEAPPNPGFEGVFAPNDALVSALEVPLDGFVGPEDMVVQVIGEPGEGEEQYIYTGVEGGTILRYDGSRLTVFAETGGRPLGLEFGPDGTLWVADAYRGLLAIDPEGRVRVVADTTSDGSPILYADDVDVAADGRVFFSDASTRFGAEASGGTYAGSVLEIMEHAKSGRLLMYDPASGAVTTVLDGLSFANGVAMCPDDACVLVNETGAYRVLRVWLTGPKAGSHDVWIDALPGFPDNINRVADGSYWVGLVSPRSEAVDALSARPFLRAVALRLPTFLQPAVTEYGHVLRLDAEGRVLGSLQDPTGRVHSTTGAVTDNAGRIFISGLTTEAIFIAGVSD